MTDGSEASGDTGAGEAFWRSIFDAMPQLGWLAQPDGYIDHYNRGWYEFTGTTPAAMEGWGWRAVHHPDHIASVEADWRSVIARGTAGEFEFPLRRHDGVYRWFLTRVNPLRDADGRLVRWVGINTDIDDLKQAQLALREQNAVVEAASAAVAAQRARYQSLFAQAPVAITVFGGHDLRFELCNPLSSQLLGRSAEQVLGKTPVEAVPEVAGQGFDKLLEGVRDTGVPFIGREMPVQLATGPGGALQTAWFDFVYAPLRGPGGAVDGVVSVATEVTAQVLHRRLIDEKVKAARFGADVGRALVEDVPFRARLHGCCEAMIALGGHFARIWTLDEHDDVLELQASAGRYTHLDGAHARVPVGKFKIGLIASERAPHLTNAVADDPRVSDRDWARREGVVSFAGYPLLVGDKLVGVMAMFGREPLSDDVLLALASVATPIALAIEGDRGERFRELFIGMLGHDLRNPLSAIMTGAQTLTLQPGATEKAKTTASRIINSSQRMGRMVTQLLDFARARSGGGIPAALVPVDLFAIAAEVVAEIQQAHPSRTIELLVEGNGDGLFDVDRMAQVLSNLVGNAISYGSPERPIKVALRGDGPALSCEVVSFGRPIAPAVLPHIFDPFRRGHRIATTTGLGLGLFITREILLAHRGAIEVSSSAEAGTSFRFRVPRAPSKAGAPS